MGGHLFIINGDLTKVACDAILIPTDDRLSVTPHWKPFLKKAGHWKQIRKLKKKPAASWGDSNMIPLKRQPKHPQIWLGKIGKDGDTSDFEAFSPDIEDFVRTALGLHQKSRKKLRLYNWDKPRLALPIIGTDHGGGAEKKGDLILGMVERLGQLARDPGLDTDIVLVAFGNKPYSAAQQARRSIVRKEDSKAIRTHWQFTNEPKGDLVKKARDLAENAIASQLVIFIGAGVSAGAGLPDWTTLLYKIAKDVKFDARERFRNVDHRDQATILERQLKLQNKSLGKAVAKKLGGSHYSLSSGLLASLPSREAVTTNFDTLFEDAWATAGRKVAVLPDESAEPNERWLLKLHGSVRRPKKIVLTRADYLDMPRQHGALIGLVQGLLMMRHMMFVGYSMRDEDFHELIHEVRHAVGRRRNARPIGTVLTLETDPLTNELWARDLEVVPMTNPGGKMSDEARSRQLEIFLDLVAYLATTSAAFFLDKTYDAISIDEEELRGKLSNLFWTVYDAETDDSVKRKVLKFLRDELGARPEDTTDNRVPKKSG
jgi:hypothetical protein